MGFLKKYYLEIIAGILIAGILIVPILIVHYKNLIKLNCKKDVIK